MNQTDLSGHPPGLERAVNAQSASGPWRRPLLLALATVLALAFAFRPAPSTEVVASAAPPATAAPARVHAPAHARLEQSLAFEPNRGQAPKAVRFVSHGARQHIEVFDDGLALSAGGSSATLRFIGASRHGRLDPREATVATSNYLIGRDQAAWLHGLPRYRQLRYADLYPGIDLVYYSRDGELEFDLVVRPGADPSRIRLQLGGAAAPTIADNGDLLLDGPGGALRLHRPVLYQNIDGERRVLDGGFMLDAERGLRFALPTYDARYPLVIDPVFKLLYSTYLGGVHDDQVGAMVLDTQGNAYVIGNSGSEDWPVSGNAYQGRRKAIGQYVRNVVVTKFDASGTLIYSTFVGGSTNDYGAAISVDAAGNAYLAGNTTSSDFPVTAGAHQSTFKGSPSAYLAILSPDGSALRYSTFLGGAGNAEAQALALDASGAPVLAGTAGPGLATTAGAHKTTLAAGRAAFVARFSPLAAGVPQLAAASYYGVDNPLANSSAQGNTVLGMALDASGAAWITGQAFTTNLPGAGAALQAPPPAMSASCAAGPAPLNSFAYVARLSADLGTLAYASYLSGKNEAAGATACSEFGRSIALDPAGNVYVAGGTASATFPVTAGALQSAIPIGSGFGSFSTFISKLKPDGSALLWSTYFGGNVGSTFPGASLITEAGSGSLWMPVLTGGGSNYPLSTDAIQATHGGGGSDAGFTRFDMDTGALKYSTYLGGSGNDAGLAMAVDGSGSVYFAGSTNSGNFPVTANALQAALTPNAFDGSDWFFSVLGSGTVGRVLPASGGSGGDVTINVAGAGFQAGATADLVRGGQALHSVSASVAAGGTGIDLGFSLSGAAAGSYDLVVINPDGTTFRKTNAFSVEDGGRPQVWANVVARPIMRTGVPTTVNFTVGNSGSVDAYFTRLWIMFPASMDYSIPGGLTLPDGIDYQSLAAYTAEGEQMRFVPVLIPRIAAGQTQSYPLQLTSTADSAGLAIKAWVRDPWFDNQADAARAIAQAQADPASLSPVCAVNPAKNHLRNCLGEFVIEMANTALALGLAPDQDTLTPTPTTIQPNDPALLPRLRTEAAKQLGVTFQNLMNGKPTPLTRLGKAPASDRERPLLWPAAGAAVAAALQTWWGQAIVTTAGGYAFSKIADQLFKPPPVDWTQSPRFNGTKRVEGPCVGGRRTVTMYTFLKDPTLTLPKTWYEPCDPKSCPRPAAGAGGSGGQSLLPGHQRPLSVALASGLERRLAGASCPPPPPSECDELGNPDNNSGGGNGGGSCSGSGGSIDPNDKFGPAGDGSSAHQVRAAVALGYQIAFENQPTATLPAARVVVTDQLDPAKVDLSTLTLGSVSFGSTVVNVPPGLKSYATVYPLDATMSVRIQGSLDPTSGLLKWTFDTIDPVTRLAPSDPTLGFLPPDTDGVKGQGYVSFTVAPKAGLPDGTVWSNQASIVFDTNAPILTPTWLNTLDATAPIGKVTALTPQAGTASFDVAWSASDGGSGVGSYTVYVSDNGGAFSAWQTGVATTSATYTGTAGHTYGFYVIATDKAGNAEAPKSAAEASITAAGPAGGSGGGGGGGGCTIGAIGQRDATLPLWLLLAAGVLWRRRYAAACAAPAA